MATRFSNLLSSDYQPWNSQLRRYPGEDLSIHDSSKIILYLENPVANGLWRLSAKWNKKGGISDDIWAEIEKEISNKNVIQIQTGKRDRKIRVTDEWKEELRIQVYERLSFLMALFDCFCKQSSDQPETVEQLVTEHEDVQMILDIIDTAEIIEKYGDAVAYFREYIWHPNFNPVVWVDSMTRVKAGSLIITKAPIDGNTITAISWIPEPLKTCQEFLLKLGKITETDLLPIFSPEEEAFAPYFDLLRLVQTQLISQEHLQPVITKAISNFQESNFTDCVSSIGLAAEDILTQVFETLFREQLIKGLTLGQLVDEINARSAAAVTKKKDDIPPDLSILYAEINLALTEGKSDVTQNLEIVRRIVTQVIDMNRFMTNKIEKIGKTERKVSVFPEQVIHIVNELIRYRNAASHKSRIPIGPYECRRTAYSFVVLYLWWNSEKKLINWEKSPQEILLDCIHRNVKS